MKENVRFGIIVLFLVVAGAVLFSVLLADSRQNQESVESLPELTSSSYEPEIEIEPIGSVQKPETRSVSPPASVPEESSASVAAVATRTSNMRTKGAGKIHGSISVSEGGPMVYPVEVRLIRIPKNTALNSKDDALVDTLMVEQGESYEFANLPLAEYMLLAISPSHTGNTGARLTPERKSRERTLSMYPGGIISGQVVNDNGEPVPEAQLFVAAYLSGGSNINAGASRSMASKTVTDDDGLFVMPGLQFRAGIALEYTLLTKAESYANDVTGMIKVGTTGVVIRLTEGRMASGRVLTVEDSDPMPHLPLFITSKMALDVVQTVTDEEGYFELAGLNPGDQEAHIEHDQMVVEPISAAFTVPAGQDIVDVEIRVLMGGRISGRIHNAETSAGISGASIIARRQNGQSAGGNETVISDSSGAYVISGLETGAYEVRLEKVEGYPDTRRRNGRQLVSVNAGQEIPDLDFALSQGLTISGIVVDRDGKPLETATVNANSNNHNKNDYDRTDAQGRFTVAGFAEGDVVNLSASKSGFGTEKQKKERLTSSSISGLRLILGPESSISGMVVNADGTPRGGQQMLAVPTKSNGSGNSIHRTGGDGKFSIDQLAPGAYNLQFYDNGYRNNQTPAATITLATGEKKDGVRLVYEMPDGFVISGQVVNEKGQPIGFASIQANGSGWANGQSDAAGKFTLTVKGDGDYGLTITHGSYSKITEQGIPAGTEGLNIIMKGRGSISGRVLHAVTREPIQGFSLHRRRSGESFSPYMNSQFKMYHDVEGRFELSNAEAGDNNIIARADGFAETTQLVAGVTPGGSVDNIELLLAPGVSLTGTVMNTNREPISGAMLFHGKIPNYNQEQAARARSKSDGTYTLDSLPVGSFEVSIDHPQYAMQTEIVTLRANGRNQYDFVLTQGGSLEGYVTHNGDAKPNQHISIYYQSDRGIGYQANTRTDDKGFYQLSGLPDGMATVSSSVFVSTGASRSKNSKAEVAGGLTTRLDFDFTTGTASVEGYVYQEEGVPATGLHVNVQIETPSGNEGSMIQTDNDGYYYVGNLPSGTVSLNVYGGNARKILQFEIREGEGLQKDIHLYGGTTVVCTLQNMPTSAQPATIVIVPGTIVVDNSTPYSEFTVLFQTMAGFGQAVNGQAEIKGIEPGTYTIVAVAIEGTPDPSDPLSNIKIASKQFTITDETTIQIDLRF